MENRPELANRKIIVLLWKWKTTYLLNYPPKIETLRYKISMHVPAP